MGQAFQPAKSTLWRHSQTKKAEVADRNVCPTCTGIASASPSGVLLFDTISQRLRLPTVRDRASRSFFGKHDCGPLHQHLDTFLCFLQHGDRHGIHVRTRGRQHMQEEIRLAPMVGNNLDTAFRCWAGISLGRKVLAIVTVKLFARTQFTTRLPRQQRLYKQPPLAVRDDQMRVPFLRSLHGLQQPGFL